MAQLRISCLGVFQVTKDGVPVSGFDSDRVRILLIYLLMERKRPCRRETLAGLFWPETTERVARTNLRSALANLRRILDDHSANPPFLLVTRQTIQFNEACDYWADMAQFDQLTRHQQSPIQQLKEAADLVSGSFLAGFSVADSAALEEWLLLAREQIARKVTAVWQQLAHHFEQAGAFEQAITYCRKLVQQEPFQEAAHRQLMRLLAFNHQRNKALVHYDTLHTLLETELGVLPEPETRRLGQLIRDGILQTPPPLPAFLTGKTAVFPHHSPRFVARRQEMKKLSAMLANTWRGQGQIAFVSGEAGSGKTALMAAFARHAEDSNADVCVAGGRGQAYVGRGDPYHLFRTVLHRLAGDVERSWQAGSISTNRAGRLWSLFPFLAQALLTDAPDLIGTFLPGRLCQKRLQTTPGIGEVWVDDLQRVIADKTAVSPDTPLTQPALFTQYTQLLRKISHARPRLLLLDDLQWADTSSISLLFHLARQVTDVPVFIFGAYRPEAIVSKHNTPHPLATMVHELQREFGDIHLSLNQANHTQFIDEWLDSEPNRLDATFRQALMQQTSGNAIAHLRQAIDLIQQVPHSPERDLQEITLQLALRAPLIAVRGFACEELDDVHKRAFELCRQVGETPLLIPTLNLILVHYNTRGFYRQGFEVGERLLTLAEQTKDPQTIAASRWMMGWQLVMLGRPFIALAHLDHVIDFYDRAQHTGLAHVYGQDIGVSVLAWSAWALLLLGYPDQAQARAQAAIDLAESLEHPFTLSFAYAIAEAMFQQLCGNREKALTHHVSTTEINEAEGFPVMQTGSIFFEGLRLASTGKQDGGIAHMEQAVSIWQSMGLGMHMTQYLGMLGWEYGRFGNLTKAYATIARAHDLAQSSGERYYEAELYRMKGELLLQDERLSLNETPESCFLQAIDSAIKQQAKLWELRATISLARCRQKQGKETDAEKMLTAITNHFSEGFDTPEYREAQVLLAELNVF